MSNYKKLLRLGYCTIGIMVLLILSANTAIGYAYSDTIHFGLSHKYNGNVPDVGARVLNLLQNNNGLYCSNKDEKKVYLTFDLGYEAGYTDEILDILQANDIKAIFFLCGHYLKEDAIVNRMITQGHSIGNHTDKHKDLTILGSEALKADIQDFKTKFENKYNAELKFFRPPYGRINEKVLQECNTQGYKTVLWSNAVVDWGKKTFDVSKCSNLILNRLHKGMIQLLHATNNGVLMLLKDIIPKIKNEGYTFGEPRELL